MLKEISMHGSIDTGSRSQTLKKLKLECVEHGGKFSVDKENRLGKCSLYGVTKVEMERVLHRIRIENSSVDIENYHLLKIEMHDDFKNSFITIGTVSRPVNYEETALHLIDDVSGAEMAVIAIDARPEIFAYDSAENKIIQPKTWGKSSTPNTSPSVGFTRTLFSIPKRCNITASVTETHVKNGDKLISPLKESIKLLRVECFT